MPVITAEGEEAVVTAWFVDEGQACAEGDLIAEVQAEKVADEVRATSDGYVVNRVVIGDPVPQGGAICRIADSVHQPAEAPPPPRMSAVTPVSVVASPAAKRIANELGVDLAEITGSGPGGRITQEDVEAAARPISSTTSLRAVIARNMRRSHAETAPVTLFARTDLGNQIPRNLTAIVVKVAAEALADHPSLNGTRDGDDFTPAAPAHVAVAIQTADGLVAPVVRDPAAQTVEDVAEAITELAGKASAGALTAVDYEGGTFTVSNLGAFGVEGFTPIINLPQVAILGVGTARPTPVFDASGAVTRGHEMTLSLTFDHAFVDGAPAAAFLHDVVGALAG